MKLGVVFTAAFLIQCGGATFNDIFPSDGGDPNAFDLTNILECAVDGGERLNVSLIQPQGATDFDYWLPQTSDVPSPEALMCVNRNFNVLRELVMELQGIDLDVQSLSPPNMTEGAFVDVCADVRSQLNATGMDLDDDASYIVSTLIRERVQQETSITDHEFSLGMDDNDERITMMNVFAALRCQVVHRWTDLGPTYLPRYYVAGRCFERGCSFPIRNGQFCRPDVGNLNNFRSLPALRWDCCWEFTETDPKSMEDQTEYEYSCGWRRVNVPLLCDCDCACPPRQ